jgi:hypothetical protein
VPGFMRGYALSFVGRHEGAKMPRKARTFGASYVPGTTWYPGAGGHQLDDPASGILQLGRPGDGGVDFQDLPAMPKITEQTAAMAAGNAAHLADC